MIRPGAGTKPLAGILGIDAALDRPSVLREILLLERQRRSRRDLDLRLDQIEARDQLGHRMLDLDAGVHFEEVEVALGVDQEFDRAGVGVVDGLGGLDRDFTHLRGASRA